jgi:uncharacterized protein
MEKNINYILLFDLYGKFLTEKQSVIFKLYFEEDYSTNEIANELDVSKQYVHKTLKKIIMKLNDFDKKLDLKKEYHK